MTPSVGRIVHLRAPGNGRCLAAIVTGVLENGSIAVTVFPPVAPPYFLAHAYEGAGADDWHQPEFVPQEAGRPVPAAELASLQTCS